MPNAANAVPIFQMRTNAPVTDMLWPFQVPFPCIVSAIYSGAHAASATDKFQVILRQGTTVLWTATMVQAADTTNVDPVDQVYLAPNVEYLVFVDTTGTPANVTGVSIAIWAYPHR